MNTPRWPAWAVAAVGFLWFLHIGGAGTLNPTNIAWILDGDWRQHWLGWLFFRHEPWTFPLGTMHNIPYPIGTSIGFVDGNPLVSLLLKPFSSVLPDEMQFVGPWLALCFVLQGYMGARLTSVITRDPWQQFLGGCLFVFSPVLVARLGHDTLCAHWLVLGLLYVGLREYADAREARRVSWLATGAVVLAAAIHPYLTAMSYALATAGFIRLWRTGLMSLRRAAVAALITTAGMFAVWFVIGYIGATSVASAGFGDYRSDLLALFNPHNYSRLIPDFHLEAGHWEGLGFLGIGGLVAAIVAAVVIVRQRVRVPRAAWPIVIVCILSFVYALSSNITFADVRILSLRSGYDHIRGLTSAFRASGRFIWPIHYLILLTGLWGLMRAARSAPRSRATALIAAVVLLQALDLNVNPAWGAPKNFRQAPHRELAIARGRYTHMAVYPTQILGGCGQEYQEDYIYRYMLEAYRLNLTYNSGIFARFSWDAAQAACGRLDLDVEYGRLDSQTIYVVAPGSIEKFTRAGAACGRFDGDWICVSGDSDERFRMLIRTGK
jgi:hypothetical protein